MCISDKFLWCVCVCVCSLGRPHAAERSPFPRAGLEPEVQLHAIVIPGLDLSTKLLLSFPPPASVFPGFSFQALWAQDTRLLCSNSGSAFWQQTKAALLPFICPIKPVAVTPFRGLSPGCWRCFLPCPEAEVPGSVSPNLLRPPPAPCCTERRGSPAPLPGAHAFLLSPRWDQA